MGKKAAKGKARIDKYYTLAKEQGYRARSAFKLIQLINKYNVLDNFFSHGSTGILSQTQKPRVCVNSVIDLCAAPGGWLQVLTKNMPVNSLILGVDLVPIKSIKNVETLAADITSVVCFNWIKKHVTAFNPEIPRVDLILNDGSPNVGTSWIHDAFVQNELILQSIKLVAHFLKKGGNFVGKLFRSKDYTSILWVLEQLFCKVIQTKPSSSRAVSAEIYVLCFGFKFSDAKSIDSKFYCPKHVFAHIDEKEIEEDTQGKKKKSLAELLKRQGKRHRDGYNEGDDYRECSFLDFLCSANPARYLLNCNKLIIDREVEEAIQNETVESDLINENSLPKKQPGETCIGGSKINSTVASVLNNTIRETLVDIKVLSKNDLARILNCRTKLRRMENIKILMQKYKQSLQKSFSSTSISLDNSKVISEKLQKETSSGNEHNESILFDSAEVSKHRDTTKDIDEDEELTTLTRTMLRKEHREKKKKKEKYLKLKDRLKLSQGIVDTTEHGGFLDESLFSLNSLGGSADSTLGNFAGPAKEYVSIEEALYSEPPSILPENYNVDDSDNFLTDEDDNEETKRFRNMELDLSAQYRVNQDEKKKKTVSQPKTRRQRMRLQWAMEFEDIADEIERKNLAEKARETFLDDYYLDSDVEDQTVSLTVEKSTPQEASIDSCDGNGNGNEEELATDSKRGLKKRKSCPRICDETSESKLDEDSKGDMMIGIQETVGKVNLKKLKMTNADLVNAKRWLQRDVFSKHDCSNGDDIASFGCGGLNELFEVFDTEHTSVKKKKKKKLLDEDSCEFSEKLKSEKAKSAPNFSESRTNPVSYLGSPEKSKSSGLSIGSCSTVSTDSAGSDEPYIHELNDDEAPLLPLPDKKIRAQKRKREAFKEKKSKSKDRVVPESSEELKIEPLKKIEVVPPTDPDEIAEIQALGSLMIKKKTRLDLIDGAYNRYAFDDEEDLPEWFYEDEQKHNRPQLPVSKELMREYRNKIKEINSRPIRKVLEAAAKKQYRRKKSLARIQKKSESIADDPELDEFSKSKSIRKLYSKIKRDETRPKSYVVSRRIGGGQEQRMKGNKKTTKNSKIVVVDRRLKKDKRAKKFRNNKRFREKRRR